MNPIRLIVPTVLVLLLAPALLAQSLREGQSLREATVAVRSAGYEPQVTKRNEVTVLEPRLAPFYHGVASGDPMMDRVIIWTRVTPEPNDTEIIVRWRVATDVDFTNVVQSGTATATSQRDFCVKVDVTGLSPATTYYYGFVAKGRASLTGRTRTTPTNDVDHLRFAVVSCSNVPAGYFNAYRGIAERNDLDAVLHIGDYIYEYSADTTSYGGAIGKRLGRSHQPENEIVTLVDYRTRYAQYRLDPDLRALHQQHPMIHVWDDHESANDAYTDGAQNHQPSEGSWTDRREISKRVCMEWMPTREQPDGRVYRAIRYGNLAELFMIDTRLDGRDKQVANVGESAPQASRDSLLSPTRRIMSQAQETWLANGLTSSTSTWKILGNQVMLSPNTVNPIDTGYLFSNISPILAFFLRAQLPQLREIFESGFYGDVWNNYPAARRRLRDVIVTNNVSNVVVATGDFHSAFVWNVVDDDNYTSQPYAAEFMVPSITSANFDENLSSVQQTATIAPQLVETINRTLTANNPHLAYVDLVNHGYTILDVRPNAVQCDIFYVDTLYIRRLNERRAKSYRVVANQTMTWQESPNAAPGKMQRDQPAPPEPPVISSVQYDKPSKVTLLGFGPQPAQDILYVSYVSTSSDQQQWNIVDINGRVLDVKGSQALSNGLQSLSIDVSTLSPGRYEFVLVQGSDRIRMPFIIKR